MIEKPLKKEEISNCFIQILNAYTDCYFKSFGKEAKMDKQNWAALHLGFIAGMKLCGYNEDFLFKALEKAQEKIRKIS